MIKKKYDKVVLLQDSARFQFRLSDLLKKESFEYASIGVTNLMLNLDKYSNDLFLIPDTIFEIVALNVNNHPKSRLFDVIILTTKKDQQIPNSDKLTVIDYVNINNDDNAILEKIHKHVSPS